MHPDNREVIKLPCGGTLIRYKPVPLKIQAVYPWTEIPEVEDTPATAPDHSGEF